MRHKDGCAFNTYFTAVELKVARLPNAAGAEAQEIHDLFLFASNEDKKDFKVVLGKFGEYCRPRKNVVFKRHRF